MKEESPNVSFPEIECNVLESWKSEDTFRQSLENRKSSAHYLFYDGPPFATGTPHYGHLLAGTIKDIIPRYQTMKGKFVERRFGWDTHGLPIEMLTEQELGISGRLQILDYGLAKFNEACRSGVLRYVKEWERVCNKLGRWVDFERDYKTMDLEFMESVWWVFKSLWDKGRIYEGTRVMPYSWRLSTPLSNFEASSNYKTVQDPAVTLRFKVRELENTYFLIWTTTPWTIPSNLGICVGEKIKYVVVESGGEHYILADDLREQCFKKDPNAKVTREISLDELKDLSYEPPFDYFQELRDEGAFTVHVDDFVTTDSGTGIVHLSPAHGEDDHRVGIRDGIPVIDPLDKDGTFTELVPDFKDMLFKDADKEIIRHLKDLGAMFHQDVISHSYPFCERSDTPLMYKAISAWYVKVEDIREQMVSNNERIHWVPESIKHGRFGKWLEAARDWNISRNRFWGNPLPVWRCDSCGELECIGSKAELEKKANASVSDLHKHFVDELKWNCSSCQGTMQRIPEVLDCWFESGSMPYAQLHYPFENKELFEDVFPADFIAEGLDQTRGWFYTLMVLSTSLFENAPFKNVIVNGMILAEDGKKMSKRLKNYPDPLEIIDQYGADALRLYLIDSPVVKGESLRFSESGVKDVVRSVLLPFWNAYSFFTTYASVDKYSPSENLTGSENDLDKWIISRYQTLLDDIQVEMEEYRLYRVVSVILDFLSDLTNWYVRRSRRRFWSDDVADKQQGYDTLYYILTGSCQALAPFLPFLSDHMYRNLRSLSEKDPKSVHLTDFPVSDTRVRDDKLESAMELIKISVSLGRALRAKHNIRLRQPLQSITIVTKDEKAAETLQTYGEHIREELNVKEIQFSSRESDVVDFSIKPNFKKLGSKLGKKMGELSKVLSGLDLEKVEEIVNGASVELVGEQLAGDDFLVTRAPKDGRELATEQGVTVFFDTTISEDLLCEGLAREVVNRVQRMRKEADFHVSDRIEVTASVDSSMQERLSGFLDYIKSETLATELRFDAKHEPGDIQQQHSIEDHDVLLTLKRL